MKNGDPQAEVDRLSDQLAENHERLAEADTDPAIDPGDRFSEDILGRDGKAFIAVAMESTKTRVGIAPFAVSIEVEAARSKLTLSFLDADAALVWIANLGGLISGRVKPE